MTLTLWELFKEMMALVIVQGSGICSCCNRALMRSAVISVFVGSIVVYSEILFLPADSRSTYLQIFTVLVACLLFGQIGGIGLLLLLERAWLCMTRHLRLHNSRLPFRRDQTSHTIKERNKARAQESEQARACTIQACAMELVDVLVDVA